MAWYAISWVCYNVGSVLCKLMTWPSGGVVRKSSIRKLPNVSGHMAVSRG